MPARSAKADRSATIFNKLDLPAAARAKDAKDLKFSDLTAAQRATAGSSEVVAIIDGDQVTILEPTGDLGAALIAIKKEKDRL